MYCLGMDGGGTKTDLALADLSGKILARSTISGYEYHPDSAESVYERLKQDIEDLISPLGITRDEIGAFCMGMPGLGEFPIWTEECDWISHKLCPKAKIFFENDVVIGMFGSLALDAGIHVVAGTGSIVFGVDAEGRTARTGGWSATFSDEGSCYWLGLKTLETFFKEADGRLEKGPLYDIVRENLGVEDDIEIITLFNKKFAVKRSETAKLQMLLMKAARAGDQNALNVYKHAAYELALCVKGAYKALGLSGQVKVSYSGGLFKTEELILDPLKECLKDLDIVLTAPRLSPIAGAVLKALVDMGADREEMIAKLEQQL